MSGAANCSEEIAVVFDLDGTLVHSAPDLHAAAVKMLEDLGLPPVTLAQVTSYIGNGVPKLVSRCLSASDAKSVPFDSALESFRTYYLANPYTLTRPYDGVVDMLESLKEIGLNLGVCTNKPMAMTECVLDGLGLAAFFRSVVCGDTLATRKPSADPLLLAFDQLGAESQGSLYVGDSEIDAQTAMAAGSDFALFSGGYRKTPMQELRTQFVFTNFSELTDFVVARLRA